MVSPYVVTVGFHPVPGKGFTYRVFSCLELVKLYCDVDETALRDLLLFMENSILGNDSRNSCVNIIQRKWARRGDL